MAEPGPFGNELELAGALANLELGNRASLSVNEVQTGRADKWAGVKKQGVDEATWKSTRLRIRKDFGVQAASTCTREQMATWPGDALDLVRGKANLGGRK